MLDAVHLLRGDSIDAVDALLGMLRGEGEGGTIRSPARRTAVGTRCKRIASARLADPALLTDGLDPIVLAGVSSTAVCAEAGPMGDGAMPSV